MINTIKKEWVIIFKEFEDLITIDDLCSMLSIGTNAAYTLLKSNKINAFRIGRVWKIPRISVEKYVLSESGIEEKSVRGINNGITL